MSSVTAKIDLTPVQSDLATVLARLTASRAANLDASISSRASAAAVATVDSMADTIAGRLTAGRAANLDNLNTTITSRASQTSVNGKASQASVNAIPTTAVASTQRGEARLGGNYNATLDIPITQVNLNKAFLTYNHAGDTSRTEGRARVYLLNSTTIRVISENGGMGAALRPYFRWQVVEYE